MAVPLRETTSMTMDFHFGNDKSRKNPRANAAFNNFIGIY